MPRSGEKGAIRKERGSSLPVALVYPNAYRVGAANLGFQYLYNHLNSHPRFSAERFFFPDSASRGKWPERGPFSEESGRRLSDFPIIAFSIPFENDYPALPGALLTAGIPPQQKDRRAGHPLIVAGGVAVSINPEPVAPFVDLIFIGEFQAGLGKENDALWGELADILESSSPRLNERSELLRRFRDLPSVYVPSAYRFEFQENGIIRAIAPQKGFPARVTAGKRLDKDAPAPASTLFCPGAEFGESLLIEVNRGCGRACRFCAAGWIHRPVRYARPDLFQRHVERAVTEKRTVGLVGSDLAGHPQLEEILSAIVRRSGRFSLSSIRPEGLTPRVIELFAQSGQKTATLAPETASLRMKKVIGKEIPPERFYDLVERLVAAGIPNVRFYFMVGLPTETDDDAHEIVQFVLQCRKVFLSASRPMRRIGRLSVQVNPFIPKPWTPFQWAPMATAAALENRIGIIRRGLKKQPNLVLRFESLREARFQALLSRGDRRVAPMILQVALQQGRRSGVFRAGGLDPDFYTLRERAPDEIFPWEITDHGVSRETLRKVYVEALTAGRDFA